MLSKALELFTLYALVDFPKHIDTISRDCQFCAVNIDVFLPLNVVFTCNLPNSVDLCGNYLFTKDITDRVMTSLNFSNWLENNQYIMYVIILSDKIQRCYGYQNAECFEQIWGHIYCSQLSSRLTMFESSFENSTWYFALHITIVRSCLNGIWALVQYGGWFVTFRFFVFSPGVMARRQDKITPSAGKDEIAKKR